MELWEVIAFFQNKLHTAEAMESWCSMKKEGEALKIIALDFDGSTQRFSQRQEHKPLRERVEEAGEELRWEASQMSLDEECPFEGRT